MSASASGWTYPRETCPVCRRRYPYADPAERTGAICFDCRSDGRRKETETMTIPATEISVTLSAEAEVRALVDAIRREMLGLRRKVESLERSKKMLLEELKKRNDAWAALEDFLEAEQYHCRDAESSIAMRQSILDKMRDLAADAAS